MRAPHFGRSAVPNDLGQRITPESSCRGIGEEFLRREIVVSFRAFDVEALKAAGKPTDASKAECGQLGSTAHIRADENGTRPRSPGTRSQARHFPRVRELLERGL